MTGTRALSSGPIRASNPCSEYMFLDDTACNLASLNLLQFRDTTTKSFDVKGYEHAIRLWTLTLEISVAMAQFPSREIARLSYDYRTLGLGYANIGGLLMSSGIPYDSDHGRAICAALSSILTGRAYATSAEIAAKSGAFPGHRANAQAMLRVIRNHKRAADGEAAGYETLSVAPTPLDHRRARQRRPCLGGLERSRARLLARCADAGRGARLSQRAGLGHRADRHDRPRHGLRHDRHRARLRAGQIQEARRRRLFQDHQPRRARGSAHARLRREADLRHRRLRRRPGDARPCAGRQPRRAQGQGFAAGGDRQGRGGARRRLRHPLRLQQMDAWRRDPRPGAQDHARPL